MRPLAEIISEIFWRAKAAETVGPKEATMTRTCPFTHCGKRIPEDKFACAPHWFSLGAEERARIWKAYHGYLDGSVTVEELRAVQQEVLGDRGQAEVSHA